MCVLTKVDSIKEFCSYKNVVIQCHNFPDADTIGSGFALYKYFMDAGCNTRLVYSGSAPISKTNLVLLVSHLGIPIEYVPEPEPVDGLLVTVDCQYGESNVSLFPAKNVLIIDHHRPSSKLLGRPRPNIIYACIKEKYGGCASVVYQLLQKAGYRLTLPVSTAMYYGVFMDTNEFSEVREPADREARDELLFDDAFFTLVKNSNLNPAELMIAGQALQNYWEKDGLAVIEAQACDPNILGLIADMLIRVENVTTAVVFNRMSSTEAGLGECCKFSVRTCIGEIRANELAEMITAPRISNGQALGGGGGHRRKAGGRCEVKIFATWCVEQGCNPDFREYLHQVYTEYSQRSSIIYCDSYDFSVERYDYRRYQRQAVISGYVRSTELGEIGSRILLRTPTGDKHDVIRKDLYIRIGLHGELYPCSATEFYAVYRDCQEAMDFSGFMEHDEPKVVLERTGCKLYLRDILHPCRIKNNDYVWARQITTDRKTVKLLPSKWGYADFTFGNFGDYVVISTNDLTDISIVSGNDFAEDYTLVTD